MTTTTTSSSSGRPPRPGAVPDPRGAAASFGRGDPSGPHSSRQDATPQERPLLRVVRGEPTAEELAALTVVVAALSQRGTGRRPAPVGAWASYSGGHRRPLQHGTGGWQAAGRPA